jgi:hypothetical protein
MRIAVSIVMLDLSFNEGAHLCRSRIGCLKCDMNEYM